MIATFTLDADSLRKDGFEVKDIHGGRSTSSTKKLLRLKEINLYSKADLKKLGSNARPVKTVHFAYSYKLCKGYPDLQDMNTGKLTLDSLWFTYNKVKRGKENPYVFKYNTTNPNYQYKAYDRWGNYKPAADNPGGIPADDYPYAVKDSTKAATNAGAWCVSDINLPSGAKMKVEYESDDYAFVQNKRALEMFQVVGFGENSGSTPVTNLYASIAQDHRFVFVDVPVAVDTKQDIATKYLQNAGKLYFKLHVQMPHDGYGSGYEYIPVYASIKDYGKVSSNRIWIELEPSPEGANKSPLATAAIQFLRLNLPSKAYSGSDVKNEPAFKAAIMAVLSIVPEITKLISGGFNNDARLKSKSKATMLSRTFVRLSSPALKKYGGGQRVKRITISDNWNKMTGKKESYYGQEYEYTTTRMINGKQQLISSGVAAYEPSIGNEENPFRQPIEYKEKATLAPSNFLFVEEPYAESLFPSASVGYSKVRVSSINRKNIKSAPGFEETEFFTAYDFPTLTDHTLFDNDSHKKGIDKFKPAALRTRKYVTQSQGFKIELNDMHGKMKSNSVFAENDPAHPIAYTEQFYRSEKISGESYRLVNTVPMLENAPNSFFINSNGQIGKDIELIADMREQLSVVQAGGVGFNMDMFVIPLPFLPPFNIPSINPQVSIENSRYRSASLLKIIQRYGIVDSVVVIDKGSKVSTRNLLWDGETGDILVSRTQNEFNDPIFQCSYPAHWAYQGMGPAYKNIDAVLQNVNVNGGKITSVNGGQTSVSIVDRMFESGDEVLVTNKPNFFIFDPCALVSFNRITPASKEKRLWVVDRSKVTGDSTKELYFIDRNGNEYSGHGVNLRIIRSGRRNMASVPVGSVTSLKSPIKTVQFGPGTIDVLSIDSTIGVLAANAAVMKDVWPVEDRFTKLSHCDSLNKNVQTTFTPSTTALVKRWHLLNGTSSTPVVDETYINHGYFTASRSIDTTINDVANKSSVAPGINDRRTRGIMQFNLSSIPEHAVIDSAQLDLYAKRPRYLWLNARYWPYARQAHTTNINESELLRIIQPWSGSTTWDQTNQITTQTDKVTLAASTDSCQDYHPNVKNMVQAMVSDPASNYGILLKEKSLTSLSSAPGIKLQHMSFCGKSGFNPDHDGGTCSTCTTLGLFVKYHYRYDSCYTTCESIFKSRINPYAQGIWGNWRALRSFVYYDRRVQSDPLAPTNIRNDGEIKDFIPFWDVTANNGIKPTTNEYVWVWNAEITRYNRRGLETENRDPLGRFSSGLYGYSNTLPIAVAQNSRYREMTYDGFEDYAFATDSCITECPTPRHFDFTAYKDSIVSTVRHTGKASLRLGAGSFASASAKITAGSDTLSPELSFVRTVNGSCVRFDSIKAISNVTYPVFSPQPDKAMVLSAWVKEDKDCKCTGYTGNSIDIVFYQGGSVL
ncbi:MAG TPA: DNRLRE domain-containing protein, partial [Chitinophagaceae bacterium]|nr:DNRLRE domain-containing protein [Chitinophagaceae bacterium]